MHESLRRAVEGAGADHNLQRAALEALKALGDEARQPPVGRAGRDSITVHLKKVAAVIGWIANLTAVAAFFGVNGG